jgi:uncharacterized phage protein (TIGR01671 family)
MREILFRGKRVATGEWIEGCYSYFNDSGYDGEVVYHEIILIMGESYQVHSETVGQYTGIQDKNGVKIFEGDYIEVKDFLPCGDQDEFGTGGTYLNIEGDVVYQNNGFELDDRPNIGFIPLSAFLDHEIEITGNIHDK